jgi:hypothetical protein
MNRFDDVFGVYGRSPMCDEGHECDSVMACESCEGRFWCDDHILQCDGCKKFWCQRHAELTKTDCGWLCGYCVEEFMTAVELADDEIEAA